jgi:hypothetical protein
MKGQKIESSFIKAVAYDSANKVLELTFKGRPCSIVQYSGVTPRKYQSLLDSTSKGEYFNAKIKGKHVETVIA